MGASSKTYHIMHRSATIYICQTLIGFLLFFLNSVNLTLNLLGKHRNTLKSGDCSGLYLYLCVCCVIACDMLYCMWRHYTGGSSMYGHGCDAASQSAHNSERGGKQAHNQTSLQAGTVFFLLLHPTQRTHARGVERNATVERTEGPEWGPQQGSGGVSGSFWPRGESQEETRGQEGQQEAPQHPQ